MLKKPSLNKPVFQVYPSWRELVINRFCPQCAKKIVETDFREEISKREYSISGLCQVCQDLVFHQLPEV